MFLFLLLCCCCENANLQEIFSLSLFFATSSRHKHKCTYLHSTCGSRCDGGYCGHLQQCSFSSFSCSMWSLLFLSECLISNVSAGPLRFLPPHPRVLSRTGPRDVFAMHGTLPWCRCTSAYGHLVEGHCRTQVTLYAVQTTLLQDYDLSR